MSSPGNQETDADRENERRILDVVARETGWQYVQRQKFAPVDADYHDDDGRLRFIVEAKYRSGVSSAFLARSDGVFFKTAKLARVWREGQRLDVAPLLVIETSDHVTRWFPLAHLDDAWSGHTIEDGRIGRDDVDSGYCIPWDKWLETSLLKRLAESEQEAAHEA